MKRNIQTLRQAPDLATVHAQLRTLYEGQYTRPPHLHERLMSRQPEYIQALLRRKFDALIAVETEGMRKDGEEEQDEIRSYDELNDPAFKETYRTAISLFLDSQVLRAHMDVGRDPTLSGPDHDIAHYETQIAVVTQNLINIAIGNNPDRLRRMGCVFFDTDGTKTIVDCTSHAHAGKYLEAMAKFLCKPPVHIQAWLKERGLRTETLAYAGDEFVIIVRSDEKEVTPELLDEFSGVVKHAIAKDEHLNSFISFDDPEFVMEYDSWTHEQRAAYKTDPDFMMDQLKESRDKLPKRFVPSMSSGSATFLESLQEALSEHTEEAETLEELGVNTYRLMISTADVRQQQRKREFRRKLKDQKWKAFLLRNEENRLLHSQNMTLKETLKEQEEEIARLKSEMETLRKEYEALFRHNDLSWQ